jgi:hypothetical protein
MKGKRCIRHANSKDIDVRCISKVYNSSALFFEAFEIAFQLDFFVVKARNADVVTLCKRPNHQEHACYLELGKYSQAGLR